MQCHPVAYPLASAFQEVVPRVLITRNLQLPACSCVSPAPAISPVFGIIHGVESSFVATPYFCPGHQNGMSTVIRAPTLAPSLMTPVLQGGLQGLFCSLQYPKALVSRHQRAEGSSRTQRSLK